MLAEIDRFVHWVRRRSPDARTWKDYTYDLRLFARLMGDRPLGQLTFWDIDHFVAWQVERGFQPATINRRLAAVLSLYAFLSDEDPILRARHHLREPQRLPRPVQEDDLRRFFAAVDNTRDRAMFVLMLRCGLRISEVACLKLADLYLHEPHPRLVAHGKGSRERSVYLSAQAEYALRAYLAERPSAACDSAFLGYHHRGLTTTAIHLRLMRFRERAGVRLSAHQLRHTFATDLVNADAPVTSIQKLLGHRWIETTQIYIQANDKQVCADFYAACERIEGWELPLMLFGGTLPWTMPNTAGGNR
jgi:site-specific recombinase XerD